jgi:hypothetical protein
MGIGHILQLNQRRVDLTMPGVELQNTQRLAAEVMGDGIANRDAGKMGTPAGVRFAKSAGYSGARVEPRTGDWLCHATGRRGRGLGFTGADVGWTALGGARG